MYIRTAFVTLLVGAFTTLNLLACGAPAMEPKTTSEQPAAAVDVSETAAISKTQPMENTQAMSETKVMSNTQAMGETVATPEPTVLLKGLLVGLGDGQHEGSGHVEITGSASAYTLKLTNFSSSQGPDLHVILSKNANPIQEKVGADWLDLGVLQATSGDQEYAIPADVDFSMYHSVVVYCVSYDFVFSAATLQ